LEFQFMKTFAKWVAAGFALGSGAADAAETISYRYDAKGRLVEVKHAGGPAGGATATYGYDPADNRTLHTVTGANPTTRTNPMPIVVVPLNGFQVIVVPPDI
jgi:YD repeat-containing protein